MRLFGRVIAGLVTVFGVLLAVVDPPLLTLGVVVAFAGVLYLVIAPALRRPKRNSP